jgi:dipeptidyl aminopeptidase/acylaminoacyl peptidase
VKRLAALLPLSFALACDSPPEATGSRKAPPAKTGDASKAAPADPAAKPATPTTPGSPSTPTPTPVGDPAPIADTSPHPFGVLDMLAMDRLSDPQVESRLDGKGNVVFVRRVTDMVANRGRTDLWRVALTGGEPVRLTDHAESDDSPRIAKDGTIYFLSSRSGDTQVWKLPSTGGDAVQVTALPLPVGSLAVSPDGTTLAFAIEVFVDCAPADPAAPSVLECTKSRLAAEEASPSTGTVYDRMFVRHWDTWLDGRRSHLFTMPAAGGAPVDVTQGLDADVPSKPFGGSEEFAFSPDGKTIVFGAREAGNAEPWSTNFDLYSVATDGSGERKNLTASNPAWDSHPRFTADGKTLVYKAMKRPGYEADRFHLVAMAWPDGTARAVTDAWDRSVDELVLAPDGKTAYVTADDLGHKPIFAIDLATGAATKVTGNGSTGSPILAGEELVYLRDDLRAPAELFRVARTGGEPTAITTINTTKVAAAQMGTPEQFSFTGANGDTVYGWVVQPVDFDPTKKYPLAMLIHGGPQGSFGDHFHYRWNPQAYAGAGYASLMIDFHGSTGYGQAFTDGINDDWGGKPLKDLQLGLAAALAKYTWIDGSRSCALGASYGGFMINWIAGNWPDGFDCLVNHDGLFDMRSMYYATEELWFPEWEHRGTQYDKPKRYEVFNPANFVTKWKTPMLVIHGALDYRVPDTQGLSTFTALQRRGIESRYLHFPNENHWVLKPANSVQWHETVLAWLAKHTK